MKNNTNSWMSTSDVLKDLYEVKIKIYDLLNFDCSLPVPEAESLEYGGHTFEVNGEKVRFRMAKITPIKAGQFVTLWKRSDAGPIAPFDISDDVDLFVVNVREFLHFGQFILPKSVLAKQDIVSTNNQGGKRAFRVYPPWEGELNRQAQKTQKWQLEYFLDLSTDKEIDYARARRLYLGSV